MPKTDPKRLAWNKAWLAQKKLNDPEWAKKRRLAQDASRKRSVAKDPEAERTRQCEVKRKANADPIKRAKIYADHTARYHDRMENEPEFAEKKRTESREQYAEKRANASSVWKKEYSLNKSCNRRGITPDVYRSMFEAQNGVCAICGKPETRTFKGEPKRLAIDHDHETGKVRALLCGHCNTAIGLLQDDTSVMQSAITYLTKHEEDEPRG